MNLSENGELFEFLERQAYSAAFSDIMDELNFRQQIVSPEANIHPLTESFVAIGRAVTLLNDEDSNMEDPYELAIRCIDELTPNTILVTTGKRVFQTGIMGELTATALRARGCRGAVVNGYTRDVRKIIKMKYPTFAYGASPIDTTGRVRVVEYNIPITIGGVTVEPGDLVFADLDGIAVIPKCVEKEVIPLVRERVTTETKVRRELAEGKLMSEVWARYKVL